jgi:hypothetical protein
MIGKVKIITGFRKDQEFSIDASEAHKAYYLFLNPDARTVFSSGLALRGSQIQRIEPDYQGTMGWNEAHALDAEDWNEIHRLGVDQKLKTILTIAQEVGRIAQPHDLNIPLSEAMTRYPQLAAHGVERRDSSTKELKELLPPAA